MKRRAFIGLLAGVAAGIGATRKVGPTKARDIPTHNSITLRTHPAPRIGVHRFHRFNGHDDPYLGAGLDRFINFRMEEAGRAMRDMMANNFLK